MNVAMHISCNVSNLIWHKINILTIHNFLIVISFIHLSIWNFFQQDIKYFSANWLRFSIKNLTYFPSIIKCEFFSKNFECYMTYYIPFDISRHSRQASFDSFEAYRHRIRVLTWKIRSTCTYNCITVLGTIGTFDW